MIYELQFRISQNQSVVRYKNVEADEYIRKDGWITFTAGDEIVYEVQEFDVVSIELQEDEE